MSEPFIKPEWIKAVQDIDLAQAEEFITGAIVTNMDDGVADAMAAVTMAAMRNGTAIVVNSFCGPGIDKLLRQEVFTAQEIYLRTSVKEVCDDLFYLDDPKYKQLLAQYERAKLQRNKHLMRDLERQLQGYRWRY